jgi:hypothetical protein
MPVEERATDIYTRDNLLLGFSQVYFTPLENGVYGASVPLGILSGEELQKEIELLQLERGDAGLIVIDRELVSKLVLSMSLETFNFKANLAQYIFASSSITPVVADASATITGEQLTLPTTLPFGTFLDLAHGGIIESTVAVTCDEIVDEAVGTGTGAANNFQLDFKVKAVADVTSVTVGGVVYTPIAVGANAAGNEVEVVIGETDGAHPTGSGSLEFFVGGTTTPPPLGAAIVVTYQPSFSGADFTLNTDFFIDPLVGRIRFFDPTGADNSPFRATGENQPMLVGYDYSQNAGNELAPFTQNVFEGKATIKHLPDVGINFIWEIPSASIRITDDGLTFDAADFAVATLVLNILNAGGSAPYGTLTLSSETEANA